jgi:hypothetical protein
MTLLPAYGRSYRNAKSVLADFNANRDFILRHLTARDCPINKEQIAIGTRIQFRYGKRLEKVLGHVV